MAAYQLDVILEWFYHPLTHPVVIEMCRAELKRRGSKIGGGGITDEH